MTNVVLTTIGNNVITGERSNKREKFMPELVHTKGTPEFRQQLDKRRRIPGEPKKGFEATQMWDRYQEIARRVVVGQSNVEIANDLGVTPQMVSYVRNSDIIKQQIGNLQEQANDDAVSVSKRIKSLAPHALKLLEEIIVEGKVASETIPAKLRAHHAEKVLDRAGHMPPKEIRSLNLHGHYTPDELEALKQRATQSAQGAGILDVEYKEVNESE